jgi:hypothetical protein
VQDDRLGQCLKQAPAELVHVDLIRYFLGEHDELVTAQARDGVGVANRLRKPPGEGLQHFVAGKVAERVVDVLEPVEIDEEQRDGAIVAPRERDRVIESLVECAAVVQARQRVESREPVDVGLDEFLLGDIESDTAIADELSVLVQHGLAADRDEAETAVRLRGAQDQIAEDLLGF